VTDSPDLLLMDSIRARWQAAIKAAVDGTAIPEEFLAALVANESGGNPDAKRFEPGVLVHLWNTAIGRQSNYGKVLRVDLVNYVAGLTATPVTTPSTLPANVFQRLDELAHSWGLTQIMGYHILEWLSIAGWYRTVDDLRVPESNLRSAALLLTTFANAFSLDLGKDFSGLLHCWNAGSPTAATFDPAYVTNAMNRMDLYRSSASV
jgi:Transglycosylase SLT domain